MSHSIRRLQVYECDHESCDTTELVPEKKTPGAWSVVVTEPPANGAEAEKLSRHLCPTCTLRAFSLEPGKAKKPPTSSKE